MGAPQDSSNTLKFSELACMLYCLLNLDDFCAAFFHVGVHAGTDGGGGGIQSVHVHGATGKEYSGLKEQNPLEMLPHV